jgi:hypothetical protein
MRIAALDVDLIDVPTVSPPFAWRRELRSQRALVRGRVGGGVKE